MSKKLKRADLGKIGNQFVLIFQADPCIVMPIISKPHDVPGHRTDVPIDPKEMFCQRKPEGNLLIKLQETKEVPQDRVTIIGKVSKASLARIDLALQRERQIITEEQSNQHHRGRYR